MRTPWSIRDVRTPERTAAKQVRELRTWGLSITKFLDQVAATPCEGESEREDRLEASGLSVDAIEQNEATLTPGRLRTPGATESW